MFSSEKISRTIQLVINENGKLENDYVIEGLIKDGSINFLVQG